MKPTKADLNIYPWEAKDDLIHIQAISEIDGVQGFRRSR